MKSFSGFLFCQILMMALILSCDTYNNSNVLAPGQSIQKAIDNAADGDTLLLKDGIYYQTIRLDKSITI